MEDKEKSKLDEKNRIVLVIRFSNDIINKNIKKYSGYFNELNRKFNDGEIFLEFIQDGFLMIFADITAFKNYHSLNKEKMAADLKKMDANEKSYLFDKEFLNIPFPEEGITLHSEGFSKNLEILTPIVKSFYKKMHPEIKLSPKSPKVVEIHFKTISAMRALTEFIYWKIYSLHSS